ncbi:methylthioribulose 1-phosphate dehydratase [Alicyclobacillus mengziensis]|nr:methylthioribulose 1-phosphate dehydratase [Alicyclobacillus mengziensis]
MNDVMMAKQAVANLAVQLAHKGWLPATSGNLSVRVMNTQNFCITPSGVDKGALQPQDVLLVNAKGELLEDTEYRPSAETVVHQRLYHAKDYGSVLHVHTVYNNLASDIYFESGFVEFANHELLKALGHWEENAHIRVPIVENFNDLDLLGQAVGDSVVSGVPAVLVRNHGIYAFGRGPEEAKRHLEALEFLFEYKIRMRQLGW